jgi:hypothetical protein
MRRRYMVRVMVMTTMTTMTNHRRLVPHHDVHN